MPAIKIWLRVPGSIERNLRLLQMDYADDADNPSTLFAIGRTYVAMERPADALPMLQCGVAHLDAGDPLRRGLYRLIVQCHQMLGQPQAALAECGAAPRRLPARRGATCEERQLREQVGDVAGAESCYLHLLREQEPNPYGGLPAGLLDFSARHQLAALYARQGRVAQARGRRPAAKS